MISYGPLNYWQDWSSKSSKTPPNAVCGGIKADGRKFYIGRAVHENDVLPAVIIPSEKCAYVIYGGQEYQKKEAQVMIEENQRRFEWNENHGTSIPYNAVPVGKTALGEPLYIGRVWVDGRRTLGTIHPSHGCLDVFTNGEEINLRKYEIFCQRNLKNR